jgi:hypothetical protein
MQLVVRLEAVSAFATRNVLDNDCVGKNVIVILV